MRTTETIQPGQWLLHLTNAPDKKWRYLEEIVPDPLDNPDMVVLKFSNGDGERLHIQHLELVNTQISRAPRLMWEISDTEPANGVATGPMASEWLALGRLVSLTQRVRGDEAWMEAKLNYRNCERLVEIPAEALAALRDVLIPGAEVEVITPALSSGVPGITEVRAGDSIWKSEEGVPVSRAFLDTYGIVARADEAGCMIVPHVDLSAP